MNSFAKQKGTGWRGYGCPGGLDGYCDAFFFFAGQSDELEGVAGRHFSSPFLHSRKVFATHSACPKRKTVQTQTRIHLTSLQTRFAQSIERQISILCRSQFHADLNSIWVGSERNQAVLSRQNQYGSVGWTCRF